MKSTITHIVDRFEGTLLSFHRNGSNEGRLYHRPSEATMSRFAEVAQSLLDEGCLRIYEAAPFIYRFDVERGDTR